LTTSSVLYLINNNYITEWNCLHHWIYALSRSKVIVTRIIELKRGPPPYLMPPHGLHLGRAYC